MNISHEEAQKLIHLHSDRGLDMDHRAQLQSHLMQCERCALYANRLSDAENTLRKVMKREWNVQPLPHNKETILREINSKKWVVQKLLPTHSALIGITVIFFSFVLWQFSLTNGSSNAGIGLQTSVIPTPAIVLIDNPALATLNECALLSYVVQANDDLDSIARKFSLPQDIIISTNNLNSKILQPGTQLEIPACNFTPTGTTFSPTITLTPEFQTFTTTPG